jgi:2-C-methyl-D-erythritol 4-phosphate cytidylyltransferase
MSNKTNLWVVIPAAGVGKRMLVDYPKQYLSLGPKTVLEQTVSRFSKNLKIKGIVIVISKGDEYWPSLNIQSDIPLYVVDGGKERCHSVFNGLVFLENKTQENDWVMVHDAARPCLHYDDIEKLIMTLWNHSVGGLLGLPVADTLKLCGDNLRVKRTVSRKGLWRALTPQMFRYKKLFGAMRTAINQPEKITDEASAMELAGYEPVMVEGRWDNIKITHPQDLFQAQLILESYKK